MNIDPLFLIALNLVVKATLIMCLGFWVMALMRKHSAAWRSLIWLQVFAVLAMLPAFALMQPMWSWQVSVADFSEKKEMAALTELGAEMTGGVGSAAPMDPFAPFPVAVDQVEAVEAAGWSIGAELTAGYIGIAALLLMYRLLGCWQLLGLKREAADPIEVESVARLATEHRLRRRIRVCQSPEVGVPMTWGVFRPVLMLPSSSVEWSAEEKEAALRHEFAHILHWDAAKRWLSAFVGAVFWPHPLMWLAARRWKLEQECACDDYVMGSGLDAAAYARQLLAAAKSFRAGMRAPAAALVMAMPSCLEVRLRAVMSGQVKRDTPGVVGRLGTVLAGLILMVVGGSVQAQVKKTVYEIADVALENRQFVIKTQFIEINGRENRDAVNLPELKEAAAGRQVKLDEAGMVALMAQLAQKKGVHLMSLPTVTCQSGQQSMAEVVREFFYPTGFDSKDGLLTPNTFEMEPIGTRVGVEGRTKGGDALQLKLIAKVTQFVGWTPCGEKDLRQLGEGRWEMDPQKDYSTHDSFRRVNPDSPMLKLGKNFLSHLKEGEGREALDRGEVLIPSFSVTTWADEAELKVDECRVGYLKQTKGNSAWHQDQHLWCLVYLEEISPELGPPAKVDDQAVVGIELKSITLSRADLGMIKDFEWIIKRAFGEPKHVTLGVLSSSQATTFLKALEGVDGVEVESSPKIAVQPGEKSGRRKIGSGVELTVSAFDDGVIDLDLLLSQTSLLSSQPRFLGWKVAGQEKLLSEEPKDQGTYQPVFEVTDPYSSAVSVRDGQTVVQPLGSGEKGEGRMRLLKVTIEPPANRAKEKSVTVLGEVWRQGKYGFQTDLTVAEAVALAKGIKRASGASRATIERRDGEESREIVVEDEEMAKFEVRDGDVVRIGRK